MGAPAVGLAAPLGAAPVVTVPGALAPLLVSFLFATLSLIELLALSQHLPWVAEELFDMVSFSAATANVMLPASNAAESTVSFPSFMVVSFVLGPLANTNMGQCAGAGQGSVRWMRLQHTHCDALPIKFCVPQRNRVAVGETQIR
jgi:hypothetical protein